MNQGGKPTLLFGEFSYEPGSGSLFKDGKEITPCLTPTEASVLECLYTNNERTVSRDELLQLVAGSRVVGSDIITQYIKRLRKALGDSANRPQYIRTHQKKGYRFIAPIQVQSVPGWREILLKPGLSVFSLLTVISLFFAIQYYLSATNDTHSPVPVTSLKGHEIDGDATEKGDYLVFSHKLLGELHWNLVIKKKGEESYFQLTDDKVHDRGAKFSPSADRLVYHHYGLALNQILLAEINWKTMHLENIEVLVEFPPELSSVYMDWEDENTLYFSSSESVNQPFQISRFDINTKKGEVITNPTGNGHGDLGLAYSKVADKWAILRNVGWSKTDVLLYDPKNSEINKLASVPQLLLSATWNKDGSGLILRTGNGQLGLLSLDDGKINNFFDSNYPIYAPFSFDEDSIGFMHGDLMVSDIVQQDLDGSRQISSMISSSFNDKLPAFAQDVGALAFVSTRSGQPQIWLRGQDNSLRQVSHFENSPIIFDTAIDKQGRFIAYIANAKLHLMDIETGDIIFFSGGDNQEPDNPVFSNDGKHLLYTVRNGEQWQLEKRNLDNMQIRTVLTEGFIAKPCEKDDCIYFMKRNSSMLYKQSNNGQVSEIGVDLGNIRYADQFHITGDNIYFVDEVGGQKHLLRHDMKKNERENIVKTKSFRFSMNFAEKIVYWVARNENDTNLEVIKLK